jgi:hypothetical protein
MDTMKGWRTLAFGFGLAIAPVVLTYMEMIDWSGYGPTITFVAGLAVMALRVITTTPVLRKG